MRLEGLDVGDSFRLADDAYSPIFKVTRTSKESNVVACMDTDLNEHIFPGYAEVEIIKRGD